MQAVQPQLACSRVCSIVKKPAGRKCTPQMDAQEDDDYLISPQSLAPITITETASQFKILLPLDGIDARKLYIFATQQSILIEVRINRTVRHQRANCQEVQHQRLTREIRLHKPIEEGATTVSWIGNNLEITCVKATDLADRAWSEFVHLDTRASLGGISRKNGA